LKGLIRVHHPFPRAETRRYCSDRGYATFIFRPIGTPLLLKFLSSCFRHIRLWPVVKHLNNYTLKQVNLAQPASANGG
jgi:hypothetical protein